MEPVKTLIDISDLPPEILVTNPGLANADGTDTLSDRAAFQAAIDWVAERRVQGFDDEVTIRLPAGTVMLDQTVTLAADGIRIEGAGADRTTIKGAWTAGPIEDREVEVDTLDASAHLLDLAQHDGLTIADATLTGGDLHGAILGVRSDELTLSELALDDFAWSAVRLFIVDGVVIEGNDFVDAGGRREGDSGPTGGGIFGTYVANAEVADNTFQKSADFDSNFYGIKGRQWSDSSIHHNTIDTNFAIEFPFENDQGVEIAHNYLDGVVSVPKYAGGLELEAGESFHVHHNLFTTSYSIEGPRNGMLVEKNAFVFDSDRDVGNLFAAFGSNPTAPGPYDFRENLVINPGRGIFWSDPGHDDVTIANNHIIANTTATPRTDGLVGLNSSQTDLSTLTIEDNVIEVYGQERGLVRNDESGELGTIVNNRLVGVSDTGRYENPQTEAPRGLTEALTFDAGAGGAFSMDSDALIAAARPDEDGQFDQRALDALIAATPDPEPTSTLSDDAPDTETPGEGDVSSDGPDGDGGASDADGDAPTVDEPEPDEPALEVDDADIILAVNIGSDRPVVTGDGTVFAADGTGVGRAYETGGEIAATEDDELYHSEAWDPDGLEYRFDLPDGRYLVELGLAEIYSETSAPGARVFDVEIEGKLRADDVDIAAEVGPRTATMLRYEAEVTDGALDLRLAPEVQNPKLSTLRVVGLDGSPEGSAGTPATETQSAETGVRVFEVDPNDVGEMVISDFGLSSGDGEASYDVLEFEFAGRDWELSGKADMLEFALFIESDGDKDTDAVVSGSDLAWRFQDGIVVLRGVAETFEREELKTADFDFETLTI